MTVDQITEAVENRRASGAYGREEELDEWTKVDSEIESMVPTAVADDDDVEDEEDAEDGDDSDISDEEDETLKDDAAELDLDMDDDSMIQNVMSAKRGKILSLRRLLTILLINLLQLISGSRELLSVQAHLGKCILEWMLPAVYSWL
jgi:hypothetical protein